MATSGILVGEADEAPGLTPPNGRNRKAEPSQLGKFNDLAREQKRMKTKLEETVRRIAPNDGLQEQKRGTPEIATPWHPVRYVSNMQTEHPNTVSGLREKHREMAGQIAHTRAILPPWSPT